MTLGLTVALVIRLGLHLFRRFAAELPGGEGPELRFAAWCWVLISLNAYIMLPQLNAGLFRDVDLPLIATDLLIAGFSLLFLYWQWRRLVRGWLGADS